MRAPEPRKARKIKLPLQVLEYHDGYCDILDAAGVVIDDDGLSRETADLVVTAVNAYDDLVAALQRIRFELPPFWAHRHLSAGRRGRHGGLGD